ncbi:MAG TPA: substrate-binding domain-containing protein [Anaerolineales bacterium]|nr:substrate-binding domain-containing protein [Anaerolineales bacterium]
MAEIRRKTIAVLGAKFSRSEGSEFISGVLESARAQDVNVICLAGGQPVAIATTNGGVSHGLYDLIRPEQVDGVLLAADVAYGLSKNEIEEFCRSFAPLPIVSIAVPAKGISCFMTDNEGGMRAILRHLIEEHRYTRIGFVRGPQGQLEADQRYNIYREELKSHNLLFEEYLVVDGEHTPESGRAAVRTLLDERGMKLQAIVTSNDRVAFGVLEALQQRGLHVPDQIALTGFDDVSESESMGVPLTTAHQSFHVLGQRAFEGLMRRISGQPMEDVTLIPSNLVVRWSCGCLPGNVQQAIVLPKEVAHTGRLENKRVTAIRALMGAAGIPLQDTSRSLYEDAFGRMWDVFLASLRESDKSDAFLKTVQTMVEILQQGEYDFNACHNVLSTFRRYALGGISSHTTMLRAENLFQQARILVGELSQRAQAYRRLQFQKQEELLNNFSFSMASAMSFEAVGDAIIKHFPKLSLERWHVMFYNDVSAPGSTLTPQPQNYHLLMQYDKRQFTVPQERSLLVTGRLLPRGMSPDEHRYDAVVMPLALANNRFGFMWAEMGPNDWDVYVRVKNLLSSAMLRIMLVQQREMAQREVERLLNEARERAAELARARDVAEKTAAQNAKLFESEQERRRGAEALARSVRQLSSLTNVEKLHDQILDQLLQVLPYERGVFLMEDVDGIPQVRAHHAMPENADMQAFELKIMGGDLYAVVSRKGETLLVRDIDAVNGWAQPDWLPRDKSWLGVPLYSKDKVIGLLALSRSTRPFTEDDALLATTFAIQATVALDNARLYTEVTSLNQFMERMVTERVEELNKAYTTLAKHDKNKSAFIQVAAHELRTPLTVIKGYLGMMKGDAGIQSNPTLLEALNGVMRGTNRLHQIVDSMLDVARLDSQVIIPHFEAINLGLVLRLIYKDYVEDLAARHMTFTLDETIQAIPPLAADPDLLKKALDHIIINAIKFTPDGGAVKVSALAVEDPRQGAMVEIHVQDTGIGIDPEHHKVIFDKLYQLGEVQLHSSGRTNFKGGGAGLGLAIASGIIKAMHGTIRVESEKRDEETCPGSTFIIRLPLAKA